MFNQAHESLSMRQIKIDKIHETPISRCKHFISFSEKEKVHCKETRICMDVCAWGV
jgi:hypothetical protein